MKSIVISSMLISLISTIFSAIPCLDGGPYFATFLCGCFSLVHSVPRGRRSSCLVYCSTPIGLNIVNFEILHGVSPININQSTHQFELKMVVTSFRPPQEQKSFHLFLLKHFNVDLKIELFRYNGYGSILYLNIHILPLSFVAVSVWSTLYPEEGDHHA